MTTDGTSDDEQGHKKDKSTVHKGSSNVTFKSPFRSTTSSSQVSFTSNISLVYACLVWLLVTELVLSYCLYTYIAHVDSKFTSAVATATQQAAAAIAAAPHNNPFQDFELYRRRKRGVRASPPSLLDDNTVNPSGVAGSDGANVEFFNPKLRQELEEKDRHGGGRKGSTSTVSGSTPTEGPAANNPWVWLTSYSRIPLVAIQGFCSATRDYCPPGPSGSPGPPGSPGMRGSEGVKGDRGDRGFPGESGIRGPPGMHGEPGPKGETAPPGLDGRDGVPGEPGLDGIPGRNGLDGLPGLDGSPGLNGIPGIPGRNGTDGRSGEMGPQGPLGPKGPRGLTGPRGRPGKPGTNGMPGIPGINAWTVKLNGSVSNDLLIPPSIAGSGGLLPSNPIVVHEGENVRLRCAATGNPRPAVEWRRLDASVIPLGSWQATSVSGHTLNITRISRGHMGIYNCIADNGVPPAANQTFNVEVHFPPLIRIQNQLVGVANGSTGILKCDVEAFPEAVRYWERADGRLMEIGEKYHMFYSETDRYKAHMQLNITNVGPSDFGAYHCIAKNEMGITKGIFTMFEIDPRLATPPTVHISGPGEVTYGKDPPKPVDLDDLCPPPSCPECPAPTELKCHDGGISLFHLIGRMEIKPFGNETYRGIPARILDCQLYAVGKPVYHRYTNMSYGSWMRDSQPLTEADSQKFWFTNESDPYNLYEYQNKTLFRAGTPSVIHELEYPFKGNTHVIYNGAFYYNERNKPHILRYGLETKNTQILTVPLVATRGSNYLYTTNYNYMDFSVDENGLWVIYGIPSSNHTMVMKVNTDNKMETQYMWNISINHHLFGEMFVACGVLYAVDSITERNSKIRFALDLYKNQLLDVNLPFTNPFRGTTMVGYNHKNKELYTWDKGNQLTYPIRYHEIGYNTSKEDKGEPETSALVQTGYDVYS